LLELLNMSTRYTQWLEKDEGEESTENSRVSNVRELIRAAGRFPTVKELLDYIEETMRKAAFAKKNTQPNKVIMSSIHASKGCEWPVVFLAGVSDGILPHARAEDIEEERRLFYVGVTRARDLLHISAVKNVSLGSRVIVTDPSQFLYEAEIDVVDTSVILPEMND
jgi:DNA helicase-2/ATP-dependent DNA helicase PcrA